MRSETEVAQAPSITPVAIGNPAARHSSVQSQGVIDSQHTRSDCGRRAFVGWRYVLSREAGLGAQDAKQPLLDPHLAGGLGPRRRSLAKGLPPYSDMDEVETMVSSTWCVPACFFSCGGVAVDQGDLQLLRQNVSGSRRSASERTPLREPPRALLGSPRHACLRRSRFISLVAWCQLFEPRLLVGARRAPPYKRPRPKVAIRFRFRFSPLVSRLPSRCREPFSAVLKVVGRRNTQVFA